MKKVVARYRVKPEHVDENEKLIERVFSRLDAARPEGLCYASLRLADRVSFAHLAVIDSEDGSNPLSALEEFADFTRDIEQRCDEPPVAQDATVVGAYRLLE